MKILKFLTGGAPTVSAITDPFSVPQLATASAASASKGSGIISDDLIKKLYDNGIPTDVDNFLEKVASIEEDSALGMPISASTIRKIEALGNRIIQLANYLKKAEEAAYKNDALGEIAVGSRGELFVADKEKGVRQVNLKDFDSNKMYALTVGELIEARKYSDSQAFNESIIPTVGRNLGLSKINEYILNIIKTVGSASTTQEAYVDLASLIGSEGAKKPSNLLLQLLQGLASLMEKVGGDAIFKNKQVMESKNMQEALAYISSVLPIEMLRLLVSRSVANGSSYNEAVNNIDKLITLSFLSGNDTKQENYINYDASVNKAAGTLAGEKETNKTFYLTTNEALFDGDLNLTLVLLSDPTSNNKYGVTLLGNIAAALTTDNNNSVNNLPMNIALNNTIAKYLDNDQIYIGNQKLNGEAELANVAYGSDKVAVVYMPTLKDGSIDWEGFKKYSQAEEYIKANNITDPMKKTEIHSSLGSYALYDSTGKLIPTDYILPYMMTYGYTIDDHIKSDNYLALELSGDSEDAAKNLIDAIYNKQMGKKTGYSDMPNRLFWDDIFRVPVFIKVSQFASGDAYRYGGHGSIMKPRTLEQDMVLEKLNLHQNTIIGNSSLLYQE